MSVYDTSAKDLVTVNMCRKSKSEQNPFGCKAEMLHGNVPGFLILLNRSMFDRRAISSRGRERTDGLVHSCSSDVMEVSFHFFVEVTRFAL